MAAGLALAVTSAAAPAHAAAKQICVAVVVDAHTIGGPVSTGCAKVKPGATGVDVLETAGHSLSFRADGLLCTIDGLPRTGCSAVDNTHYWAYFHRAPGSTTWSYSDEGPSTYTPANDSTEGWVYDDGRKLTPRNVRYAAICPPDKPTPSPTHRATPTPRHPPSTRPRPAGSASSAGAMGRHGKPKPQPVHRHHRIIGRPSHAPTLPPVHGNAGSPQPVSTATGSPAANAQSGGGGHGGLIGSIVAAVIVAGLGGAAILTNRRRT